MIQESKIIKGTHGQKAVIFKGRSNFSSDSNFNKTLSIAIVSDIAITTLKFVNKVRAKIKSNESLNLSKFLNRFLD